MHSDERKPLWKREAALFSDLLAKLRRFASLHHMGFVASNSRKFSREEWDFEPPKKARAIQASDGFTAFMGCSRQEAEYCYQYEFMRAAGIKHVQDKAITCCDVSKHFFDLCGRHFPKRPWLLIPERERLGIIDQFRGGDRAVPAISRCSPEVFTKGSEFEDVFGVDADGVKHFTVIPFAISWHETDEDIRDAFWKWLKANAPPANDECKIKFAGKDPRAAMVTALKQLGALRLCPYGSVTAAVAYTQRQKEDAPLYSERTWRKNADRAKNLLDCWLDPLGGFFSDNTTAASELCKMLSKKNRLELGKRGLKDWLTAKITPWGARRYLILKDEKVRLRLELVCRYGGAEEPQRVLRQLQAEKLSIGLDKHGNRLSRK